jgi:hypothetical protein
MEEPSRTNFDVQSRWRPDDWNHVRQAHVLPGAERVTAHKTDMTEVVSVERIVTVDSSWPAAQVFLVLAVLLEMRITGDSRIAMEDAPGKPPSCIGGTKNGAAGNGHPRVKLPFVLERRGFRS